MLGIGLLLLAVHGRIPVIFEFNIYGVKTDHFDELEDVVADFLNVSEKSVVF